MYSHVEAMQKLYLTRIIDDDPVWCDNIVGFINSIKGSKLKKRANVDEIR